MDFIKELISKAKTKKATIIFPEAEYSPRVQEAIRMLLTKKICSVYAVGESESLASLGKGITIVSPKTYPDMDKLAHKLYTLRQHKGLTLQEAKQKVQDPLCFATMLVSTGVVDGMVAGAETSSADVLRTALQILRSRGQFVNSAMLMTKKGCEPKVFADIALNLDPTSDQLAVIAQNTAKFTKKVLGTPKVALLSYSTLGSGKGESVDKVRTAVDILSKSKQPFAYIGEVQADVALSPVVAKHKKVKSKVAGNANVLIFPDINAGNIGYKLVQEMGGYSAIGPITVGLDKPVNDLSRGAKVEDIYYTTIITILQV